MKLTIETNNSELVKKINHRFKNPDKKLGFTECYVIGEEDIKEFPFLEPIIELWRFPNGNLFFLSKSAITVK